MDTDPQHWHLDKRFSVSHLVSTLLLAGSLFMWASNMESRIATLTADVKNIEYNQENQSEALRREITYLRGSVDKLNDKLDRLIERQ